MGAFDGFPSHVFAGVELMAALGTDEGDFLLGSLRRGRVGFGRRVGPIQAPAAKGTLGRSGGNRFGAAGAGATGSRIRSFLWSGGLFGTGNDDGVLTGGTVDFLTSQ